MFHFHFPKERLIDFHFPISIFRPREGCLQPECVIVTPTRELAIQVNPPQKIQGCERQHFRSSTRRANFHLEVHYVQLLPTEVNVHTKNTPKIKRQIFGFQMLIFVFLRRGHRVPVATIIRGMQSTGGHPWKVKPQKFRQLPTLE